MVHVGCRESSRIFRPGIGYIPGAQGSMMIYEQAIGRVVEIGKQVGAGLLLEYSGIVSSDNHVVRVVGWVIIENMILIAVVWGYDHYKTIHRINGIKARHKGVVSWSARLQKELRIK